MHIIHGFRSRRVKAPQLLSHGHLNPFSHGNVKLAHGTFPVLSHTLKEAIRNTTKVTQNIEIDSCPSIRTVRV